MFSLVFNAVSLLPLSATPAGPSFAETWYREVFEGNLAVAARDYETLYLGQPSEKLPVRVQQKAAFRAGLCFERLGLTQSAVPAYIIASGTDRVPGDPQVPEAAVLAMEAVLKLRGMEADTVTAQGAEEVHLDVALQSNLDLLKATERRRFGAIAALEGSLLARRAAARPRQDLIARLEARGVEMVFPAPAVDPAGEGVVAELKEAFGLDPEYSRLLTTLKGNYASQALAALRAHSLELAFRMSHRLALISSGAAGGASGEPYAKIMAEIPQLLEEAGSAGGGAAAAMLAERRLVDLDLERKPASGREIRSRLDEAAGAEQRGRRDQALPPLERIRSALDWTAPAVRQDSEIRSLATRALLRERFLVKATSMAEALLRPWAVVRGQADRIVQLSEALVEELAEEARLRGPAQVRGRPDARDACRAEVDRLLAAARGGASPAQEGKLAFDAPAERALLDAAQILDWVPSAGTPSTRAALDSLVAAQVTSPDSKETRKQDPKTTK